jgi:hypothetical protein
VLPVDEEGAVWEHLSGSMSTERGRGGGEGGGGAGDWGKLKAVECPIRGK